jgi:hypothetical protein
MLLSGNDMCLVGSFVVYVGKEKRGRKGAKAGI